MPDANRLLSITLTATSPQAASQLRELGIEAERLGLATGTATTKTAGKATKVEHAAHSNVQAMAALRTAAGSLEGLLGPLGPLLDHFHAGTTAGLSRSQRGLQTMGAAATAVGGLVVVASNRLEAAQAQLKTAVQNAGRAWDDHAGKLHKAAEDQARYGHTTTDATKALTTLTAAFNDPERAIREMSLVADEAARSHLSLADAAQKVASVAGGNLKTLRQYGINIKDITDPVKELAAARQAQAAAATAVAQAEQQLADFEANLQAQHEAGTAAKADAVEAAKAKVADARQHVAEVEARQADARQARQVAAHDRLEGATEHLVDARQHVADVLAQIHADSLESLQDRFDLRDAGQALGDVEQRIADGQLAGLDAQQALQAAHDRLTEVQTNQAAKHAADGVRGAQALAEAQHAATAASAAHDKAAKDAASAGKDTTAEHNSHRDALDGLAQARAALTKARRSGAGGETLKQVQQERDLRAKLADSRDALEAAHHQVADAKHDADEFGSKVGAALDAWQAKVKGSAEASAHTVEGHARAWAAKLDNLFAGLGSTNGMVIMLLPQMVRTVQLVAAGMGKLVPIIRAIGTGLRVLIAPITLEMLPVIAAIAIIGLAGYELYHHWDAVMGALGSTAKNGAQFLAQVFHAITTAMFAPAGLAHDGINALAHALNAVHFKAALPSMLGGATFEGGFDVPLLPALPHFADGGTVPGQLGQPVLAVVHGGEEVTPAPATRLPGQRRQPAAHGSEAEQPRRQDIHVKPHHFPRKIKGIGGMAVITSEAEARELGQLLGEAAAAACEEAGVPLPAIGHNRRPVNVIFD
jgi:chemotaxis protein histidine kinase CheA